MVQSTAGSRGYLGVADHHALHTSQHNANPDRPPRCEEPRGQCTRLIRSSALRLPRVRAVSLIVARLVFLILVLCLFLVLVFILVLIVGQGEADAASGRRSESLLGLFVELIGVEFQ